MADYYISQSTGADGNPGTIGQPWQTLDKVSAEFLAGTFGAGDNIYFMAGDTWEYSAEGLLRIRGSSGSFGSHIHLQPYGVGAAPHITRTAGGDDILVGRWNGDAAADYITIEGFEISGAYGAACISARDCSYWIIRDCEIHNTDKSGSSVCPGIYVQYDSHHIWIENCEIYDIDGEGLYLGRTTGEPQSDYIRRVTVRNCDVHDCLQDGLDLKGVSSSCFIVDTDFEDCGPGGSGQSAIQVSIGGLYQRFMNMRVIGSTGSNDYGLEFTYTYSGQGCRYIKIDHCLFKNAGGSGGAALRCRSDDNYLTNLTIVGGSGDGIEMEHRGWGASNVVRNCIFDDIADYQVYILSGAYGDYDFDYNRYGDADPVWYLGAAQAFAQVQAGGDEANGTQTDPSFDNVDTYDLAVGSPCIDDGESAATTWDWNLEYGTGAPAGAVDMGWREYDWTLPNRVFRSQCDTTDDFTATNNAAVSAAAAYSGSNGIRITLAGASDYVERDGLGSLDYLYTRMYFDPSGLTMAGGDEFTIMEVQDNAGNVLGRIELDYDGTNLRVRAAILADDNSVNWTGYHNVNASDWNQVELFWMRSVLPAVDDWGEIILYVDAEEVDTVTGINNDTRTADEIWFGAITGQDAGTSGTMDLDLLYADEVREIGSAIDWTDEEPPPFEPTVGEIEVFLIYQDTYKSMD